MVLTHRDSFFSRELTYLYLACLVMRKWWFLHKSSFFSGKLTCPYLAYALVKEIHISHVHNDGGNTEEWAWGYLLCAVVPYIQIKNICRQLSILQLDMVNSFHLEPWKNLVWSTSHTTTCDHETLSLHLLLIFP